jgi:dTDP-glucose 4,6-dehydratase
MSIIVFGGSGFIGSRFIKCWSRNNSEEIVNVDKLSYASDSSNLDFIENNSNYTFYHEDINNKDAIRAIIRKHKPSVFINFAAETHVDNSIQSSYEFIKTNVLGVQVLLDLFRECYFNSSESRDLKFIQVSTYEV